MIVIVYVTLVGLFTYLRSYKTSHDDLLNAVDTFNKELAEEYKVPNAY